MRRVLMFLSLLALITITGCGTADVDEPANSGPPLAQPNATTESTPTTTTGPAKTERGLIAKQLNEIAGITDPDVGNEQIVRFAIESITVDPKCTNEYAEPAEHGHFIVVRMNMETTAKYDPVRANFRPDPLQFSIQGPDGFTEGDLGTAASYSCLNTQEQLPVDTIGPAGKYAGSIVLDSKNASGILMFKPYTVQPGGWEWTFPAAA